MKRQADLIPEGKALRLCTRASQDFGLSVEFVNYIIGVGGIMHLNLIFEHFTNKMVKSKDVFDRVIKNIDNTYIFQNYRNNTYIVVDPELMDEYIQNGYTIFNREGKEYVNLSTMTLTFFDIPLDDRDQIRDHLIELYGKNAVRYQLIEEKELVGGKPISN